MAGTGAVCKKCFNVFMRLNEAENPCPICRNTDVILLGFETP